MYLIIQKTYLKSLLQYPASGHCSSVNKNHSIQTGRDTQRMQQHQWYVEENDPAKHVRNGILR